MMTAAGSVDCEQREPQAGEKCIAETDCEPVQTADLVLEDVPFLWHGKPLSDDASNVIVRKYAAARLKYPTLESCIRSGNPSSRDISSFEVRWRDFLTEEEAEVCLFRVLNVAGSPRAIETWLTEQGFIFSNPILGWKAFESSYGGGASLALQMVWQNDRNGPLFGSGWRGYILNALAPTTTIFVIYSERRGLLHVALVAQIK